MTKIYDDYATDCTKIENKMNAKRRIKESCQNLPSFSDKQDQSHTDLRRSLYTNSVFKIYAT